MPDCWLKAIFKQPTACLEMRAAIPRWPASVATNPTHTAPLVISGQTLIEVPRYLP